MENSTRSQEKKNPFLQTSSNMNSTNNGVQIQTLISESKPIYRSELPTSGTGANTYPTTFIEADSSSFKQVVQMLTGSSETAKQASKSTNNTTTTDPLPKSNLIPPNKTGTTSVKKQGFKLYERRNNNSFKNIKLSPLIPGSIQNCRVSPRNHQHQYQHHYPEILSPSMLDFPSLMLSPVTPLISDPFNRSSPASVTSNASIEEEDRAIAEKGFYLHPSPISTPRDSEPQLLPLFPLTSPKTAGSSSSSDKKM